MLNGQWDPTWIIIMFLKHVQWDNELEEHKCLFSCTHHYSIAHSIFTAPQILCCIYPSLLSLQPLVMPDVFTVSIVLPFPECQIAGIIQYRTFTEWPLSLSNIFKVPLCLFIVAWQLFFLKCWKIFYYLDVPAYLSLHLLKQILAASKFWQLNIKLL